MGTLHGKIGTDFMRKTHSFKTTPKSAGLHRPNLPLHPAAYACVYQHIKVMCFFGGLRMTHGTVICAREIHTFIVPHT